MQSFGNLVTLLSGSVVARTRKSLHQYFTHSLVHASRTRSRLLLLLIGVLWQNDNAHAQTTEAVAEALFRDGKSHFQAGEYDRACPKLAQSYKIDPAGGTVLLLAICYEQQGKLASAWARYNDALALAKRDGREDREHRAQEGLETVEPNLSYVRLTLDPSCQTIAGLTLSIDGIELPAVSDTRLPIDPGAHSLVIKAPNYEDWRADVNVSGPADLKEVLVPALRRQAPPPTAPTTRPIAQEVSSMQQPAVNNDAVSHAGARRAAYVIGGVGVAAIGVGSYFGLHALKLNKDANRICPTPQCGDGQLGAIDKINDAQSSASNANIFIGAGSAAVLSAAVLWLIYRNDTPATVAATANVSPESLSVNWEQSF